EFFYCLKCLLDFNTHTYLYVAIFCFERRFIVKHIGKTIMVSGINKNIAGNKKLQASYNRKSKVFVTIFMFPNFYTCHWTSTYRESFSKSIFHQYRYLNIINS